MSSILLVGDIGTVPYHVGDEASFNEVSRHLRACLPDAAQVSSPSELPQSEDSLMWLREMLDTDTVRADVDRMLAQVSLVWLVGAGNINSIFPRHLYHRLWLIRAAQLCGVPVVATSQTLGPFSPPDRELFAVVAREVAHWSVRDKGWSAPLLAENAVSCTHVFDDAADLPTVPIDVGIGFNIGISLRDWDGPAVASAVRAILEGLSPTCHVHLIPHLWAPGEDTDLASMRNVWPGIAHRYDSCAFEGNRCDIATKSVTARMDLIIATRYHAAVFAVTSGVRCICLYDNAYYERKMRGLEEWSISHLLVADAMHPPTRWGVESLLSEPASPLPQGHVMVRVQETLRSVGAL